jgi:hypothetical protein
LDPLLVTPEEIGEAGLPGKFWRILVNCSQLPTPITLYRSPKIVYGDNSFTRVTQDSDLKSSWIYRVDEVYIKMPYEQAEMRDVGSVVSPPPIPSWWWTDLVRAENPMKERG